MRRRVVDTGKDYALIEDTESTSLVIVGSKEVAEIKSATTWKKLERERHKRDTVKKIIGETTK